MSGGKRVSNKKHQHEGSRCKRVRLGYHRKRNLKALIAQRNALAAALDPKGVIEPVTQLSEEGKDTLQGALWDVKNRLYNMLPRKLLRRSQVR